ncbi:EutN/CcmL family microcompartment protein [Neobacillus sp. Marseille-QA0830]
MYVGIVVGSVVATRKDDDLVGKKLLIVEKVQPSGEKTGVIEVAVDSVGAGRGEYVVVTKGKSAGNVFDKPASVIDAAIVAIVDSLEVEEVKSFEHLYQTR